MCLPGLLALTLQAPPAQPISRDPRLEFLLGPWTTRNTHHPNPLGPAGNSTGTARYGWELNGAWLLYESRFEMPGLGAYEVRGGVAREPRGSGYRAFAYNSFGALIEYLGAWDAETRLVFTVLRTAPGSGARVIYEKHADGSVVFVSESEREDGRFVAYFESVMTRTAASAAGPASVGK